MAIEAPNLVESATARDMQLCQNSRYFRSNRLACHTPVAFSSKASVASSRSEAYRVAERLGRSIVCLAHINSLVHCGASTFRVGTSLLTPMCEPTHLPNYCRNRSRRGRNIFEYRQSDPLQDASSRQAYNIWFRLH